MISISSKWQGVAESHSEIANLSEKLSNHSLVGCQPNLLPLSIPAQSPTPVEIQPSPQTALTDPEVIVSERPAVVPTLGSEVKSHDGSRVETSSLHRSTRERRPTKFYDHLHSGKYVDQNPSL